MKQWTVYFRDKNGSKASVVIEAEDRSGVFAELKKRGISPISVTEGASNKKPRKAVGGSVSPKGRSFVAAAVAVLIAGVATWLMWPEAEKSVEAKKEVKKSVKEKPVKKNISQHISTDLVGDNVDPAQAKLTEDERLLAGRDTNEWIVVTDPNTGKKHLSKLMRTGLKNLPPPYFKRHSLNVIDAIQYCEMGDPLIGVQIDARFMEDLKQAMMEKIEVNEGDDEDRVAHKNAMVETLEELKKELKKGGDIKAIILEALSERRRVSSLKDAMKEERRRMRNEGVDEQEIVEFERACNKKLEELGARPMITKELMLKKARERRVLLDN